MTDVAQSSPVTDAVLDLLRTIENPAGGNIQVGDAVRPPGPTPAPATFFPYAVVHTGLTLLDGTYVEPKEDGLYRIQVNSIGLDRAGAEWLRDQGRALLCDPSNYDIAGYVVVSTEFVTGLPTTRDDDVTPPLHTAIDVINVLATPAAGGS